MADLVDSFSGDVGSAAADCDDRRSIYRPIVWVLIGLGAATLVASTVVRAQPSPR